jgi:signal transduction histidine kinase
MDGWGWQIVHDPQVLPEVLQRWERSRQNGEPFEMVFPLRGADDLYRPFLTRVVPIRDAHGTITQWFGTNTDITEQKRLEQQKDEFIGIASHELKTPVTCLKGYAQLLVRKFQQAGDAPALALLQKMDTQLNKLTSLIGDLLDVTKIESGHLQLHLSSFDLNTLIQEVVEEMQRTTVRHTIVLDLAPPVTLWADPDRIGQVLTNLLTNAIKYSPQSSTIIVKTVQQEEKILTSVQDFGIGISKEMQASLFERFFRVEGDTQSTYPGLGLGLYISAEFVRRHHGDIWAQSEQGKGTTMTFSLPLEQTPKR